MQSQTYIVGFIFAGLAVAGALTLVAVACGLYLRLRYPDPKPTEWENEWRKIEENISR